MRSLLFISSGLLAASLASAQTLQYGDADLLGTGSWSSDPTAGATLVGLAPGVSTFAALSQGHGFPFSPSPGEFPGTDQIYTGSAQTMPGDGYSQFDGRLQTAQTVTMDYASLVDGPIESLTLGIAADDFQQPVWDNLFTASINGVVYQPLTDLLNSLNQTGPQTQFFAIGLPTNLLAGSNILTLTIDEARTGSDGWAIDFLTIGVTTVPTPGVLGLGLAASPLALRRRRK
jgi:hypothetical protein